MRDVAAGREHAHAPAGPGIAAGSHSSTDGAGGLQAALAVAESELLSGRLDMERTRSMLSEYEQEAEHQRRLVSKAGCDGPASPRP